MAVCTPSGRTLPSNLSIIPSEQLWVFHAIYQYALPHLYSPEVCSRNCLVLTDKDEAEYRLFEALIKTTSDFKLSTVMICTFHGVWMAFKKDLLTLLEDCDCGKVYGKLVYCCINWYIQTCIIEFILISIHSFFGYMFGSPKEWLYKLFMHQACVFFIMLVVVASQPLVHVTNEIFPISMLEWKHKSPIRMFVFQVIFCDNGQIRKDKL